MRRERRVIGLWRNEGLQIGVIIEDIRQLFFLRSHRKIFSKVHVLVTFNGIGLNITGHFTVRGPPIGGPVLHPSNSHRAWKTVTMAPGEPHASQWWPTLAIFGENRPIVKSMPRSHSSSQSIASRLLSSPSDGTCSVLITRNRPRVMQRGGFRVVPGEFRCDFGR
jgi:hypothetical protein